MVTNEDKRSSACSRLASVELLDVRHDAAPIVGQFRRKASFGEGRIGIKLGNAGDPVIGRALDRRCKKRSSSVGFKAGVKAVVCTGSNESSQVGMW